MTSQAADGPGRRALLFYSLPALVLALPTIPVYVHLPALYGTQLGVGLAATGWALLLARIFDTVTDPLIGVLSDRGLLPGGRRKPWIVLGAVVAGLGLVMLLSPPATASFGYLLAWSVVLYAGWTMVAVPYTAWGAEISPDYHQRTRITSLREGLSLVGIIVAGAVLALTASLGWSEVRSVGAIAWTAVVLGTATIPLLAWQVPEVPVPAAAARAGPSPWARWREGVASLAKNGPFVRLLTAWFLNGVANGLPAALFILYLDHGLGAGPADRPAFVLVYFIAAIAAIPLWLRFSRRFGKHRVWCGAMIMACVAFVLVPMIGKGDFAAFMAVCVVTGAALGADLALPPAIQADVVDYDRLRSGRSRAGLQFALWSMSTKLALAFAVGTGLPALELLGFDPSAPGGRGLVALVALYALVPVVIKITAIAIVWRFPLTQRHQAIIRRRLERRERAQAAA